uniref:Globin family profile domain-containing protein n=1 Tax=Panagrolaimus sp. ES5 TaxID=591445 RepID=A0AC34F503_9BILA
MGNETSSTAFKTSHSLSAKKLRKKGKLIDVRSKSVFDSGIAICSSQHKNNSNFIKKKHSTSSSAFPSARVYIEHSPPISSEINNQSPPHQQQHLLAPPNSTHFVSNRKGSYCDGMSALSAANLVNNRRRSRSLCVQQLKNDCQAVANSQGAAAAVIQTSSSTSRRSSNGVLPSLTRLRIVQCYKSAKPTLGQLILKRACSLRSDIKMFISYLPEEKVEELANDIYNFITDCVNNIEDPDKIGDISIHFGEMHAQLCNCGFRPEFFSTIADATIAECVRLDGGAHKRCETLLAWSQLMAVMFSSVRDGYYAQIRAQRRSSLPQHRQNLLKQASVENRNSSFENDA